MAGINVKYNYKQNLIECKDKLTTLCNMWEMDTSEKDTMSLEVDDDFISTIYSTVRKLLEIQNAQLKLEQLLEDLENEANNRHMNDLEYGEFIGLQKAIEVMGEIM